MTIQFDDIDLLHAYPINMLQEGDLAVVHEDWFTWNNGRWNLINLNMEEENHDQQIDEQIEQDRIEQLRMAQPDTSTITYNYDSDTSSSTSGNTWTRSNIIDFVIEKPSYTTDLNEFQERVLAIAQNVMGEENASIDLQNDGSVTYLMLRWPELTIRNRHNRTHHIKEMYVGLKINEKRIIGEMKGTRGVISAVEDASHYMHSHLPGVDGLMGFCTGSDGINELIIDIGDTTDWKSEEYEFRLEGLLHQISSFVRYESLEGLPYRRIGSIRFEGQRTEPGGSELRNCASRVAHNLQYERNLLDLSFDFVTGQVKMVNHEAFEMFVKSVCGRRGSSYYQFRNANGTYDNVNNHQQRHIPRRDGIGSFIFKGESIEIYAEEYSPEIDENKIPEGAVSYVHRNIFNHIRKKIEQAATERLESILIEQYKANYQDEGEGTTTHKSRFDLTNLVRASEAT